MMWRRLTFLSGLLLLDFVAILLPFLHVFGSDSSDFSVPTDTLLSRIYLENNLTWKINLQVCLNSSAQPLALSTCQRLFHDVDTQNQLPCIALTLNTIRDNQLLKINEITSKVSDSTLDGDILSVLYGFERRSFSSSTPYFITSLDVGSGDNVCIIGTPSIHSIVSLLSLSTVSQIMFFRDTWSSWYYDESFTQYCRLLAQQMLKSVHFIPGDPLKAIKLLSSYSKYRLCDIWYVVEPSEYNVTGKDAIWERKLTTFIDIVGANELHHQAEEPAMVFWVRDIGFDESLSIYPEVFVKNRSYVPYNTTASLLNPHGSFRLADEYPKWFGPAINNCYDSSAKYKVSWKMSALFPQQIGLDIQGNVDGFTARTYVTNEYWLKVRAASVGQLEHCKTHETMSIQNTGKCRNSQSEKDSIVIAITYTIRVFAETAFGLERALHQAGYRNVFILPEVTPNIYDYLRDRCKRISSCNGLQCFILQIAIGPQDFVFLMPNYVVFQMEQVWSPVAFTGVMKYRYGAILSGSLCIFSYSYLHAELLNQLGYPCVRTIPMYSQSVRDMAFQPINRTVSNFDSSDILYDFSFFGSCSDRRREMLLALSRSDRFPNCEVGSQTLLSLDQRCFRFRLNCVDWKEGLFDNVKDSIVRHSRLIVNIHHDSESVLEVHRINQLLSMKKCVISEHSNDTVLDSQYANRGVIFVDNNLEDILTKILYLLDNQIEIDACEQAGYVKYLELSQNVLELDGAMSYITAHLRGRLDS